MIRYEEGCEGGDLPKIVVNPSLDGEPQDGPSGYYLRPKDDCDDMRFDQYTKLACRVFKVGRRSLFSISYVAVPHSTCANRLSFLSFRLLEQVYH